MDSPAGQLPPARADHSHHYGGVALDLIVLNHDRPSAFSSGISLSRPSRLTKSSNPWLAVAAQLKKLALGLPKNFTAAASTEPRPGPFTPHRRLHTPPAPSVNPASLLLRRTSLLGSAFLLLWRVCPCGMPDWRLGFLAHGEIVPCPVAGGWAGSPLPVPARART
ncbi:hypothetical protein EJ06DRAFT_266218 [Trichodelitschia bisporula]|uniref:Uncharacterized protein n=1 Tax=Trichodelitschia bisporula TaxID=703511 RepID=A0A6G1HIB2_9PEZI|nr:hypothetical protein EJ06DRAFT_266218 [Trichodelitschia bisporula]